MLDCHCESVSLSLQEEHMPEEVNIDELLDLQSDEERTKRLQVQFCSPHTRQTTRKRHFYIIIPFFFNNLTFFFLQDILQTCNNNTELSICCRGRFFLSVWYNGPSWITKLVCPSLHKASLTQHAILYFAGQRVIQSSAVEISAVLSAQHVEMIRSHTSILLSLMYCKKATLVLWGELAV